MNRIIKIELLCPSSRCPKCERVIENIKQIFSEFEIKLDLTVVTDINEMLKYDVAIIPALFVNGKLLFVGVIPRMEALKRELLFVLEDKNIKK